MTPPPLSPPAIPRHHSAISVLSFLHVGCHKLYMVTPLEILFLPDPFRFLTLSPNLQWLGDKAIYIRYPPPHPSSYVLYPH